MGQFNEIQKGVPDLGKNYWQELHQPDTEENQDSDIVDLNCQTIFNAEKINIKNNQSIFEK